MILPLVQVLTVLFRNRFPASTPGMAPGDGSHGYVEAGALDASLKAMMRAARPELYVRQEAGSPLMGLV